MSKESKSDKGMRLDGAAATTDEKDIIHTDGNEMDEEEIIPVTEEEADDIRVTLHLDDEDVECRILTIFDCFGKDYIALLPLDADGNDNEAGEVYLYRYYEDDRGLPSIDNIDDDDEYEAVCDRFDEWMDEELFEEMADDED